MVHQPAQLEESEVEDEVDDPWMVHYVDLHPSEGRSGEIREGEPCFHCARSLKFHGDENAAWHFGGHVMRIMSDCDKLTHTSRTEEDVMVCNRDNFGLCFPTDWEEELNEPSSTFGLPFVHSSEYRVSAKGELLFQPVIDRDIETGADCQVQQKSMRYISGTQSAIVSSAVCIPASCVRCSANRAIIPTADNYEEAYSKSHGPSDESGEVEPPTEGNEDVMDTSHATVNQPPARSTRSHAGPRDKGKGRAKENGGRSGFKIKLN